MSGWRFDCLRCLSGVDYLTDLETVYHFYSFRHGHSLAIKVRCPNEDPHVPTVSHLWHTANWHERETHELFGIVFDGHPDLRPLLTEEGLGYYIMRKSHPLADIEEWQEDYLATIEQAKAQMAAATGVAPPVDEKALKIQMAQQKGAVMKKARDEARAKGLSPEDEKAAVQAAIKKFEEEFAAGQGAAPAAAPSEAGRRSRGENPAGATEGGAHHEDARGSAGKGCLAGRRATDRRGGAEEVLRRAGGSIRTGCGARRSGSARCSGRTDGPRGEDSARAAEGGADHESAGGGAGEGALAGGRATSGGGGAQGVRRGAEGRIATWR